MTEILDTSGFDPMVRRAFDKEISRKVTRQDLLEDFYLFCLYGLEMPLYEQPHREMCEFWQDFSQKQKLMLVPRDTWKTSIGSTAFPLWMVVRAWFLEKNPSFRCLIDSSTVRLSQFVLDAIANYAKNGRSFIRHFGELYRDDLHSGQDLDLAPNAKRSGGIREPNFLASGVNAAKTGLHFELIIGDDLVTKENSASLAQREKVYRHYQMMYGIIESQEEETDTLFHVTGTRYNDDDIYGRIIKADEKRVAEGDPPLFAKMIRACEDEDGVLFFPAVLTKKVLSKKKDAMGGLFYAQFHNDPNKENAPFKKEQLRFTSLLNFPEKLKLIRMTVDPAIKEEEVQHGDFTCMGVGGFDKYGQPWILDVMMGRDWTSAKFFDNFFYMATRWQVEAILLENTYGPIFQETMMREIFERRARGLKFDAQIEFIKSNKLQGKLTRWKKIQPFSGRPAGIHIAEEIPESVKLEIVDQWSRAPYATYDDFMDMLEMQFTYMPIEPDEVIDGAERSVAEIMENVALSPNLQTLEQRFPHLKALRHAAKEERDEDAVELSRDNQYEADVETALAGGLSWR